MKILRPFLLFLKKFKMKYINYESWTVTWLHEGNMIVEDQLTHNFMPKPDSTTQGRGAALGGAVRYRPVSSGIVSYAAVQNVSRSWKWLF